MRHTGDPLCWVWDHTRLVPKANLTGHLVQCTPYASPIRNLQHKPRMRLGCSAGNTGGWNSCEHCMQHRGAAHTACGALQNWPCTCSTRGLGWWGIACTPGQPSGPLSPPMVLVPACAPVGFHTPQVNPGPTGWVQPTCLTSLLYW